MSQSPSVLRGVSRASPCTVCNGTRRCVYSTDGLRMCRYRQGQQPGLGYFGPAKGDPVWHRYRVEGASDVLALSWLGLGVVGRPSNSGGAEELARLLVNVPDREIVVLGEWDAKPDGQWPDRDGAVLVGRKLQTALRRPVTWALPPNGAKDARAWFHDHELEALAQASPQALFAAPVPGSA
jgi:hypothetical protein